MNFGKILGTSFLKTPPVTASLHKNTEVIFSC